MRRYRPTSAMVTALRRAGDIREPHRRRLVPVRGSVLARGSVAGVLTGIVLAVAACGTGQGNNGGAGEEPQLDSETEAACEAYTEVVNQWGREYGTEMGAVGEAAAEGDEERQEQAVETVRELFLTTAESLRDEAEGVSDEDLVDGLTRAADGAEDVAGQIETYEDVEAAPDLMEEGEFAAGGEQVQRICAGD